jgi:hypothetical protein
VCIVTYASSNGIADALMRCISKNENVEMKVARASVYRLYRFMYASSNGIADALMRYKSVLSVQSCILIV